MYKKPKNLEIFCSSRLIVSKWCPRSSLGVQNDRLSARLRLAWGPEIIQRNLEEAANGAERIDLVYSLHHWYRVIIYIYGGSAYLCFSWFVILAVPVLDFCVSAITKEAFETMFPLEFALDFLKGSVHESLFVNAERWPTDRRNQRSICVLREISTNTVSTRALRVLGFVL